MTSENNIRKHVLVVGGGPAGIEVAAKLSQLGIDITLIEQTDRLGGKLNKWNHLFPNGKPASDLLLQLSNSIKNTVKPVLQTTIAKFEKVNNHFSATLNNGNIINADAVVLATGFNLFDARKKEEYGYGIYDNVITSADLEEALKEKKKIQTNDGKTPKRICMIHCVGSRDEKVGNTYCSQVCCITAVKQAIELKKQLPDSEIFCFYMDLRMFGRNFEEIYKQAQVEYGIQFIRGRLSEAFENSNGSLMLKVEDTLLNKPLKINADLVVLMVGMEPSATSVSLIQSMKLKQGEDRFIELSDPHLSSQSNIPGIFTAGTCTGPKTLEATINNARSTAFQVAEYLK
jgi:heterodisulfide reductase subunit A